MKLIQDHHWSIVRTAAPKQTSKLCRELQSIRGSLLRALSRDLFGLCSVSGGPGRSKIVPEWKVSVFAHGLDLAGVENSSFL